MNQSNDDMSALNLLLLFPVILFALLRVFVFVLSLVRQW